MTKPKKDKSLPLPKKLMIGQLKPTVSVSEEPREIIVKNGRFRIPITEEQLATLFSGVIEDKLDTMHELKDTDLFEVSSQVKNFSMEKDSVPVFDSNNYEHKLYWIMFDLDNIEGKAL